MRKCISRLERSITRGSRKRKREKPVSISRAVVGIATVLALCLPAEAEKAPFDIPQSHPTSRMVQATCDAVWPYAVRTAATSGWSVKASDRAGGILTLESSTEQTGGYRYVNPFVGKYTTAKSTGFWTQYTGFRSPSATVILTPSAGACEVSIAIIYHGRESRGGRTEWWVLQSNGRQEDEMLSRIAVR